MVAMVTKEELGTVLEAISDIQQDSTVPKNIKKKLEGVSTMLQTEEGSAAIHINKALDELGEISDDINIQPYTRTQIWNIVSILETF